MGSKAASKATSGQITIKQYRSAAGYDKRTKAVLAALGLGRIGKERVIASNPAVLGQVHRVAHLVTVTQA